MSTIVVNGPFRRVNRDPEVLWGLGGAACLALLLTSSGAFDTDDLALPHRLGLWLLVSVLVFGQVLALDSRIGRLLASAGQGRRLLAAGSAIAVTILLLAVELHALKYTPLLPKAPDPWPGFILFVTPPVTAVAALALLLRWALRNWAQPGTSDSEADSGSLRQQESAAEPERLGQAITSWPAEPVLHMQADDHYLHVVTAGRKVLIRGRMSDALVMLGAADGMQVHRSYWVSRAAISRMERDGRSLRLVLHDGTVIPVARSRATELREQGWEPVLSRNSRA